MMLLPTGQYPGAHRCRIGGAIVTALADGFVPLNVGHVSNASADSLASLFESPYSEPETYRSACNAFLIEVNDQRILIDSGGARSPYASLGQLEATLTAIGIMPESIDILAITHLHPDHAGGAFHEDGSAVFPNARLALHALEHAFWHNDTNMQDANSLAFNIARKAVAAYEGRLTVFTTDRELAPGLHSVFLPGHTPGHTGYRIESEGDALLIWGDIVHILPVQFDNPGVGVAFDVDGAQAEVTRRQVMAHARTESLKIAGMHLPFPAFGSVDTSGEGYRFVPAPYSYTPDV